MAPVVIAQQPRIRPIVITQSMFSGDENRKILDGAELPKYAVGLFESNGPGPRKRKRLTHLTPEEKIMRRKLKNRVAAQTARDRKKVRLETLEESVGKIHEQTKKLLDLNCQLIGRTEALECENEVLRQRLGLEARGSFTKEKKAELSSIKREFNEIVSFQNMATKDGMNSESSDDESYCILTPYEGDSITIDERSCSDFSPQEASKCGSPVPAAGSCQSSEADPLASQKQRNVNATSNSDGNVEPSKDDPDITNLLRALEAVNPQECIITYKEGNATRSSKTIVQEDSFPVKKLQIPINVFRDHGYTKPMPCVLYNEEAQEASFIPSSTSTVVHTRTTDSKKLTALVEEPRKCTQQLELQIPSELMDAIAPYSENASADNALQSDDIDMEAVLDSLISENGALNIEQSARLSPIFSETGSDSGVSSCGSPLRLLDTPSPLSDSVDLFDIANMDCSLWDDQLATDLFPQLAIM